MRLALPRGPLRGRSLSDILGLDLEPVRVALAPVIYLGVGLSRPEAPGLPGGLRLEGVLALAPGEYAEPWWLGVAGRSWLVLGRRIPAGERLRPPVEPAGGGSVAAAALRVEALGSVALAGSLLRHEDEAGRLHRGLLEYGVTYRDIVEALGGEAERALGPMDPGEAVEEARRLLGPGARVEAPGPGALEDLAERALHALARALERYVARYELRVEDGVLEGLYLSSEYERDHEAHRGYVERLQDRLDALEEEAARLEARLRRVYAEMEALRQDLRNALYYGDQVRASWVAREIDERAARASELEAELSKLRARIARYRGRLRAARKTTRSLLAPSPQELRRATRSLVVLYPVVVEARLRGLRGEGLVEARIALEGYGEPVRGSGAWITHPALENPVLAGEWVPCAYGDALLPAGLVASGRAACSVCGAPVCGRHAVRRLHLRLLGVERRVYCPLHAPSRLPRLRGGRRGARAW